MPLKTRRMLLRLLGGIYLFLGISAQASGADEGWRSRSSLLRDTGVLKPIVLNLKNREQHFLFPVAQNVKIKDAYFDLDAAYYHQFACTDGLTVQIDGVPARAFSLSQEGASATQGAGQLDDALSADTAGQSGKEVHFSIPLTDLDPALRFVDIGISFNSKNSRCAEIAGHGNEIALKPSSGIRYLYDPDSVRDVRSFLTALPKKAQVLLPDSLTSMQYEAALRLLLGLRNQGLDPQMVSLPKPGDEISISGLHLPEDLSRKAMFGNIASAISQHQPLHVAGDADVAAWLALRLMSRDGFADIVIDSSGVSEALVKAAKIWTDEDVLKLLPAWINKAVAQKWQIKSKSTLANLSVENWVGTRLLLLDDAASTSAAMLTGSFWSSISNGAELGVDQAMPLHEEPSGRLMIARDLPVRFLKDSVRWNIPFYARDFPKDNLPNSIELHISGAKPGPGSAAIASVYINDTLITAQRLNTDGDETLVAASVPFYSLKANNVVRVEVDGHDIVQSVPLQVLPSSYLGMTGTSGKKEFFSLIPALVHESTVVVPVAYLQHPEYTLPVVSRVLQGLQMIPSSFKLKAVEGGKFTPKGAFVSFDVTPEKLHNLVESRLDKLTIRDKMGAVVFDSRGLGDQAVIQLVEGQGVLVNRVGLGRLDFEVPLSLSSGNLAVLDSQGVKLVLNTNDPSHQLSVNESNHGLKYLFKRYHTLLVILSGILGLIFAVWATIRTWSKARKRAGRE